MPNTASALQSHKKSARNQERNRPIRKQLKNCVKKVRTLAEAGDIEGAYLAYANAQKKIDQAAAKGVIHQNKASRQKSRLARFLNRMAAEPRFAEQARPINNQEMISSTVVTSQATVFLLEPRTDYLKTKNQDLPETTPLSYYLERFRRVYSGFGTLLKSRVFADYRFEVSANLEDQQVVSVVQNLFPAETAANGKELPVIGIELRIASMWLFIRLPAPDNTAEQKLRNTFSNHFVIRRPGLDQPGTTTVVPADQTTSPFNSDVSTGTTGSSQLEGLGDGSLKQTYAEVLEEATNDPEFLQRCKVPLIILDTGLDLTKWPAEFPDGTDDTFPPNVKCFQWASAIKKFVEVTQPNQARDLYSSDKKSAGIRHHGTRVAIRAVGAISGVYRGAPIAVYTLPFSSASQQQDAVNDLSVELLDVLKSFVDHIPDNKYMNHHIIWNLSLTVPAPLTGYQELRTTLENIFQTSFISAIAAAGNQSQMNQIALPADVGRVHSVGALIVSSKGLTPDPRTNSTTLVSNTPLKPTYWAVGRDPVTQNTEAGTSFAAPVLAAKLLYCYHKGGVQEISKYLARIKGQTIAMQLKQRTTNIAVVQICENLNSFTNSDPVPAPKTATGTPPQTGGSQKAGPPTRS